MTLHVGGCEVMVVHRTPGADAVPVSSHSDRAALFRDSTALPTWGGGDKRIPKQSLPY